MARTRVRHCIIHGGVPSLAAVGADTCHRGCIQTTLATTTLATAALALATAALALAATAWALATAALTLAAAWVATESGA